MWGAVVGGMVLFLSFRLAKGPVIDTGLLSLLPSVESNPLLAQTNDLISRRGSRLMAFVLTDPDPDTRARWGKRLSAELESTGLVGTFLTDFTVKKQLALRDLYFPLRYQLLSPSDRNKLARPHALGGLVQRLREALFNPASGFFSESIPLDPFLFFTEYFRDAMGKAESSANEGDSFFLAVEWNFDPFHSKKQETFYSWLTQFRQTIARESPQAKLYATGVLAFARAQRIQTERELYWMSLGSLVGVLGLLWWVFKKPTIVWMALLPVGIGMLAGFAATLAVFGRVHIITLTFGTTLMGCSVDYPIHFLSYRRQNGSERPEDALRTLTPGLVLGMATSVMGYLALGMAPLPGLQQIAVFSTVGLLAAIVTVYAWLAHLTVLENPTSSEHPLVWGTKKCLAVANWLWNGKSSPRTILLPLLIVGIGAGLFQVRFDDDVRHLQKTNDDVLKEDAEVRKGGSLGGNRFILIEGPTEEILLQRQEILYDRLTDLTRNGLLETVHCLAPLLPSLDRQKTNGQLVQQVLLSNAEEVTRALKNLGFAPAIGIQLLKDVAHFPPPLTPEQWLSSPASEGFRNLWIGKTQNGFASAAMVGGVQESGVLEKSLAELPGVRYFDQVKEFSNILKRYRMKSIVLVGIATVLACVLLMVRYGRVGGIVTNLPPVIGLLLTFSLFGWLRQPVNIFHAVGAVLVLAMGVDYAIFFSECRRTPDLLNGALLSVSLSAATTLVSFGLLCFCSTPAVAAVGQTIFSGLFISFVLSPLPLISNWRTEHQ